MTLVSHANKELDFTFFHPTDPSLSELVLYEGWGGGGGGGGGAGQRCCVSYVIGAPI